MRPIRKSLHRSVTSTRRKVQKARENAIQLGIRPWGEDRSNPNLVRKIAPEAVEELAKRLQQPQHADISAYANSFPTFSECLGAIAAKLDILLEGDYNVPDLCELLCRAMDARGTLGNTPHKLDSRLVNAEILERPKSIEILETSGEIGTIAPQPVTDMQRFMIEHDCQICENIAACKHAKKCLGKEAVNETSVPLA